MRIKLAFIGWAVVLLVGCGSTMQKEKTLKQINAYDFSEIDAQIQTWIKKGYYPGASILIVKDDRVVLERYYGTYTPQTVVYLASAGKWPASATIASLVDEGRLSWDDPVAKWLPEFTDIKGQATLRQLMSHTSGYPDYHSPPKRDVYQTLIESAAAIVPLDAVASPGEVFLYGGLAMQTAGRMAEAAGGMEWEALFQTKVAKPLQMKATRFTPVDDGEGHAPMLGGGARGTLNDYGNFLSMVSHHGVFRGRRILSESAIRQMEADHVGSATVHRGEFVERVRGGTHTGIYGLGLWREELDTQGQAVLISSPSWAGTYPWIDRANNIYGIFLTHVDTAKANPDGFSGFTASPILATMTRLAIAADR